MSSNEDGENRNQGARKRKLPRACFMCRQRKIRCDGINKPDSICSNCILAGCDCTYAVASIKRGPYHGKAYVQKLESRLVKLERLFRQLHPDLDLEDIDTLLQQDNIRNAERRPSPLSKMSEYQGPDHSQNGSVSGFISNAIRVAAEVSTVPDDDQGLVDTTLLEELGGFSLDDRRGIRFVGKSSDAVYLQAAIDLKREFTGTSKENASEHIRTLPHRREEFWTIPSWELLIVNEPAAPSYQFPEADLMAILIDKYFAHFNLNCPLLHRPTFERAVRQGLYLTHEPFGAVVLLVCANGAKFCHDPRVLLEGTTSELSRGWKWFLQVSMTGKSLLRSPTLYDLQQYCLAIHFLKGSSAIHCTWSLVGMALRLAQDVGIHRWKGNAGPPSVEYELWKRAFWVLITMDRICSTILGRPSAIGDEDFDLEYPIEVDDEYWEHPDPEQAFKQPPNKPSLVTAFNYQLRLTHTLGIALRTLYCNKKSRLLLGLAGQEQTLVAQFDSNLNKWMDTLPAHLRWDPNRQDDVFFDQSADLHAYFYYVQLVVHRPFIRTPAPFSFPSMTICTNAARTCSHIVDSQRRRRPSAPIHNGVIAAFASGIVLLLRLWTAKRSGLLVNPSHDMSDVYKCMDVLRAVENRWSIAGRLWDILRELADVGDLPLPQPVAKPHEHRANGTFSPPTSAVSSTSQSTAPQRQVSAHHAADSRGGAYADSSYSSSIPLQTSPQSHPGLPGQGEDLVATPHTMNDHFFLTPHTITSTTNQARQADESATLYDQIMATYGQQYVEASLMNDGNVWPSTTTADHLDEQNGAIPEETMVGNDMIDMWMSAPAGFAFEDWGRYLSNVDEITHGNYKPS